MIAILPYRSRPKWHSNKYDSYAVATLVRYFDKASWKYAQLSFTVNDVKFHIL
jgi:hypothetical protein